VNAGGQVVNLSSVFSVTNDGNNPAYLFVSGLDRNEYPSGSTGVTGTLNGNGQSATFSSIDSVDGRGVGIAFTYNYSTGRYFNATYGYFDQLTYTTSTNQNDITNLSVFGASDLTYASHVNDPYYMVALANAGVVNYLGSTTFATEKDFTGTVLQNQATPNTISNVAQTFVGKAWNPEGCWVLASTIAAEAGTSLPVDSTMTTTHGNVNGEWFLAFDGTKQTGIDWATLIKPGDMISYQGPSVPAHITTCVDGSGYSAWLIDNMNTSSGPIYAEHPLWYGWNSPTDHSNISDSSVKIYRLDTPVVTNLQSLDLISGNVSKVLSQVFTAADPKVGKSVTQYQIYDTSSSNNFTVSGSANTAHSASSAITVSSLSSISVNASSNSSDDIWVRAYNGNYWGDWQKHHISDKAEQQAQELYITYCDRPADVAGLNYWAQQIRNAGGVTTQIENSFGNSAESQKLYNGMTVSQEINAIYHNVFNRDADSTGLNYWVNRINAGQDTAITAAWGILNGANGNDSTSVYNKFAVAQSFDNDMTAAQVNAYATNGYNCVSSISSALNQVDYTSNVSVSEQNLIKIIGQSVPHT
jgi:hypothetical protein